jgi:hypothetical protein
MARRMKHPLKRRYTQNVLNQSIVLRLNRYELAIAMEALEGRLDAIRAQQLATPTFVGANDTAAAESVLLKLQALAAHLLSGRAA